MIIFHIVLNSNIGVNLFICSILSLLLHVSNPFSPTVCCWSGLVVELVVASCVADLSSLIQMREGRARLEGTRGEAGQATAAEHITVSFHSMIISR